jgi:hypothetical protein
MDPCLNTAKSKVIRAVSYDTYNSSDRNQSPESMSTGIREFDPLKPAIHLNNI